jgi:hypothetical protein
MTGYARDGGHAVPYRLLLAILIFVFYGIFAALWLNGDGALYTRALAVWAVRAVNVPGHWYAHNPLPFFDLEGVLSWRDCHLLGVDLASVNPCDPLGRPPNYPPLWLHLPLDWIGVRNTLAAGLVANAVFLFSLPVVLDPRDGKEFLVAVLAVISHVVLFAVERANVDVLLFPLCMGAIALWRRRMPILAFAVTMLAGLLKLYPFLLLATLMQEGLRRMGLFALATAIILIAIFAWIWRDMAYLAHHMPLVVYFGDMFGALLFPYGVASNLHLPAISYRLLLGLGMIASLLGARRVAGRFASAIPLVDWTERRMAFLLWGALFIAGTFFLQPSVDYRAIYLLPLLPGLMTLRRQSQDGKFNRLLDISLLAVLFCLYSEMARAHLTLAMTGSPDYVPGDLTWDFPLTAIFLFREAIWWFVATLLTGLVLRFVVDSQAFRQVEILLGERPKVAA